MRFLLMVLVATFGISISAQAEEFRCFSEIQNPEGKLDVFLYGSVQGKKVEDFRGELLAANGWLGLIQFSKTTIDLKVGKHLNVASKIVGGSYVIKTTYNSNVGDYQGTVTTIGQDVDDQEQPQSAPIRCVVLRGF